MNELNIQSSLVYINFPTFPKKVLKTKFPTLVHGIYSYVEVLLDTLL